MRRMLILFSLCILLVPNVFARRKPDKAGKVSDYVYTDKEFDFKLKLNEGWKYKINKNEDPCRMILTQVDYAIPPDYASAPDYTKIPRVVVCVVEANMSAPQFIDSLVSESYDSEAKDELLKEFEILRFSGGSGFTQERITPRERDNIEVSGLRGNSWIGQMKYTNEVSRSASSTSGIRVKGAYGGYIAAIKNGEQMLMFHLICEWPYFETVKNELMKIIYSLEWKEKK